MGRNFVVFACDIFGFSYFAGLSLVIGLPRLGIVPITNAVLSNARVSVVEACHGRIFVEFMARGFSDLGVPGVEEPNRFGAATV